ncbi:hypothetical protein, partial [Sporisorium scitamineum]
SPTRSSLRSTPSSAASTKSFPPNSSASFPSRSSSFSSRACPTSTSMPGRTTQSYTATAREMPSSSGGGVPFGRSIRPRRPNFFNLSLAQARCRSKDSPTSKVCRARR